MSLFLLDTDTLSLLQEGNPQVLQHINQHPRSEIALSTISLQEQMQGFLAARSMRLNVGAMDLRISAIALENGLTVATRNLRDFGRVPGLACVDWSV